MAENKCKYYKLVRQVSYNSGQTWSNVDPPQYQQGDLYELHSSDCPSGDTPTPTGTTIYRWVSGENECIFTDKWTYSKEQVSYDGGITWSDTGNYGDSQCLETDAEECGWVMPNMNGLKWYKVASIFDNATILCNDVGSIMPSSLSATSAACDATSAITNSDIYYTGHVATHTFVIGDCVNTIGRGAFRYETGSFCSRGNYEYYGYPKLHVIIPSSVTNVELAAFEGTRVNKLEWSGNTEGISIGEECFSGAIIDNMALPTTITRVGVRAFATATITNVDTITFNKKVHLQWPALAGCPFKKIVFNAGFTCDVGNSSAFDYTFNTEEIIFNGNKSDYPSNYMATPQNSYAVFKDNTV